MRIQFLIHQFYPTSQYGAETYAYHLGQGLQGLGHQVSVFYRENHVARDFARNQALLEEDGEVDGLSVRRVFLNPRRGVSRGAFFHFLTTFYNPSIEKAFARHLDRFQPDLVHVHHLLYLSAGLLAAARRRRIPIVATLHDFWYFCPNAQLLRPGGEICGKNPTLHCGRCMKALYGGRIPQAVLPLGAPFFLWQRRHLRRAMSQVQAFVAPSQFLLERYVREGYPADRMTLMEYGLPGQGLAAIVRSHEPAHPLHVGYIGSLTRHKGVHVLVEAFLRIPPERATLDVYGSPDAFPEYSARLQQMAEGRPHIRLRGAFEHSCLGEVLQGLDLLVVPSLWYENSPVVIQEAFGAGVPVVASRLGSLPEKVKEGVQGRLFEPGDVESLFGVLSELLSDPARVAAFQENLRDYRNDFAGHLQWVAGLYDGLISRAGIDPGQ
jgi:glycosyltransferase involved in cell wall biosynthesis